MDPLDGTAAVCAGGTWHPPRKADVMIEIRKVLCPVDLSEYSRHARDHAFAIAGWYGSSVTVLHVVAREPVAAYAPGFGGFPPVILPPPDRAELRIGLRRFVEADANPAVPIDVVMRDGDAVPEILALAKELPADLLVLGTHGFSGFERLVLGSVTEKILRRAECPVLSVPPRAPEVPPSAAVTYKRILCPVDFSLSAMSALRYATSLAEEADAQLTVLHVTEYGAHDWPELYEMFMTSARVSVEDYRKRCDEISRERLELAVPDDARRYCTVESIIAGGKPYREILQTAAERRSDLIVMGVRGRGALSRMLFGSTTQHVVRMAACPVLTLRGAQVARSA
jgi:nucleotide-binding universal stress UspA family protein